MTTNFAELKAAAMAARASGLISVKPPKPKREKRHPRHATRKSNANLGVVSIDGVKWVVEFRKPCKLVVRQFYRSAKHVLSLEQLVEVLEAMETN